MSNTFEKITDWITANFRTLNQEVADEKTMRVKLAMCATGEGQTEFVILELADDNFFIPALFNSNEIRNKFGFSDLSLSIENLEGKMIKIKTYAVSAYRSNGSLYPYLIITDFENIKKKSRIDDDLQHVCTEQQVVDWIDHVQQGHPNMHEPVSKRFSSSALMVQYPNLGTLEQHLEAILSRMYKFAPRIPVNTTRERERSSSIPNHTGRGNADHTSSNVGSWHSHYKGNTPSQAMHQRTTPQPPAAAPHSMEWHPPNLQRPPPRAQPLPENFTLQEYLLSTFDTMDEIPDELCIDAGSELKEESQADSPSPRAYTSSPHFAATNPGINLSTATPRLLSITPEPMSPAHYSPGPSHGYSPGPSHGYSPGPSPGRFNTNSQIRHYNNFVPTGRSHDFDDLPHDADSFKRRKACTSYRQQHYLMS